LRTVLQLRENLLIDAINPLCHEQIKKKLVAEIYSLTQANPGG